MTPTLLSNHLPIHLPTHHPPIFRSTRSTEHVRLLLDTEGEGLSGACSLGICGLVRKDNTVTCTQLRNREGRSPRSRRDKLGKFQMTSEIPLIAERYNRGFKEKVVLKGANLCPWEGYEPAESEGAAGQKAPHGQRHRSRTAQDM